MRLTDVKEKTIFKIIDIKLPKTVINRLYSINFATGSYYFIDKIIEKRHYEIYIYDINSNKIIRDSKIIIGYHFVDKIEIIILN